MLVECVALPIRTIDTIINCSLAATVRVLPRVAVLALTEIVGRGARVPSALNRYGGLKTSASRWFTLQSPHRPPPPVKTRASGNNTPVLWYVRAILCFASSRVNSSVAGSQISAEQACVSPNQQTTCQCDQHDAKLLTQNAVPLRVQVLIVAPCPGSSSVYTIKGAHLAGTVHRHHRIPSVCVLPQ